MARELEGIPNRDDLARLAMTIDAFYRQHDRKPEPQELADLLGVHKQIVEEWLMWMMMGLWISQREEEKKGKLQ